MRSSRSGWSEYLIGAAVVWSAILLASAISLKGTPYFGHLLLILMGGVVWFVVIVPGLFFRAQGGDERRHGARH
jgi:hypothetical protein